MTRSNSTKTKKLGQYFSPTFIVQYILKNTILEYFESPIENTRRSVTILDPSVGQGVFLTEALKVLKNIYSSSETGNSSEAKEKIIKNQLYGIDIDREQVLSTRKLLYGSETEGNIKQFDALSESWKENFPETEGRFNIIVGNPPWGAAINTIPDGLHAATAQMDTWSLFIEHCINGLEDKGYLGFIVPNTLLTNPNYIQIRHIILKSSRILKIVNLGEDIFPGVTQPSMILIIKKELAPPSHKVWVVPNISKDEKDALMKGKMTLDDCKKYICSQTRFTYNPQKEFDILSIPYDQLIQAIEKDLHSSRNHVTSLGSLVINGRGVEIGRNGRVVICQMCGYYNSPPKTKRKCRNAKCNYLLSPTEEFTEIISDFQKESVPNKPFLTGYQIHRYFTNKPRFIETQCYGINYKNPHLYQGPKLLLRKTGKGMNWVIDYEDRWVSQVVYIFKLREDLDEKFEVITIEYLLGILNSDIMQQYINAKFLDPERNDFPHFIQKSILQLPIKVPNNSREEIKVRSVGEKASHLQNLYQIQYDSDSNLQKEIISSEEEIEEIIKELYSLGN